MDQLGEDRISELPDDVLVSILSFLTDFKEAARTSVVSKRWTNLCRYFDRLDFDDWKALPGSIRERRRLLEKETRKFVQQVNKVLQSHKALALKQFRVNFDLDNSSREVIDKWLEFAFTRNVQRLGLEFDDDRFWNIYSEYYAFPYGLLDLRCVIVCFKSLKELSLKRVNVPWEVLDFFLHNCQFLERLVVHESEWLTAVEAFGPYPALKHLEICYCTELKSISLCNANLVSLKIPACQNLVLNNVPMLVDVHLVYSGYIIGVIRRVIPRLSCCLSKLEFLTLFVGAEYACKLGHMLPELPQLPNLKQLTFGVHQGEYKDYSLLGLTSFIRGAPNLEKLVIKVQWCSIGKDDRLRRDRELQKAANYPLRNLKVFELSGYYGTTSDVELVKFISENATGLEKIMIIPREYVHLPESSPCQMDNEQVVRDLARKQLKGLIAPQHHVKLEIL